MCFYSNFLNNLTVKFTVIYRKTLKVLNNFINDLKMKISEISSSMKMIDIIARHPS